MTYADNCRVVWHGGGLVLLDAGVLLDSEIFHIASTEDDIFVDLVRRRDLFTTSPTFCAEGTDILEGDCGFIRIDFMQSADVADVTL
jgi:hypothetical protein